MNERIQKLALQATNDVKDEFGHWINSEFNKEKFAELIVAECMNVLAESREVRQTAYYYRNRIAKHFGVEND